LGLNESKKQRIKQAKADNGDLKMVTLYQRKFTKQLGAPLPSMRWDKYSLG
jgi:hypothetical protein